MSDSNSSGFGKFVPGFDFLQNLAQGAAGSSTLPNFGKWVAPTLDVEELDKRIEELKIVRFWLEQNSNALGATIQALEVQKMTLATLKGMNFNFGDAGAGKTNAKEKEKEKGNADAKAQTFAPSGAKADVPPKPGVIDPMQLWGSLTQQFQKIAESAVKDASGLAAQAAAKTAPTATTKANAAPAQRRTTAKPATRKPATRKPAPRKPAA